MKNFMFMISEKIYSFCVLIVDFTTFKTESEIEELGCFEMAFLTIVSIFGIFAVLAIIGVSAIAALALVYFIFKYVAIPFLAFIVIVLIIASAKKIHDRKISNER